MNPNDLFRREVLKRDSFSCQLCGNTKHNELNTLQLIECGSNIANNYITFCWHCAGSIRRLRLGQKNFKRLRNLGIINPRQYFDFKIKELGIKQVSPHNFSHIILARVDYSRKHKYT